MPPHPTIEIQGATATPQKSRKKGAKMAKLSDFTPSGLAKI
jgi:hypothetical protein